MQEEANRLTSIANQPTATRAQRWQLQKREEKRKYKEEKGYDKRKRVPKGCERGTGHDKERGQPFAARAQHRENEEEYSRATEAYLKIEPELSKIQREAVQRYIDTLQAADTDQTDNAYIAGIRDGIRFMVSFGLIEPAGKLPFGLGDLQAK